MRVALIFATQVLVEKQLHVRSGALEAEVDDLDFRITSLHQVAVAISLGDSLTKGEGVTEQEYSSRFGISLARKLSRAAYADRIGLEQPVSSGRAT